MFLPLPHEIKTSKTSPNISAGMGSIDLFCKGVNSHRDSEENNVIQKCNKNKLFFRVTVWYRP